MESYRLISVVGARPNFMKMAPILRELSKLSDCQSYLVHTGQHYDDAMSGTFFRSLQMPPADFNLEVGSGTHAVQTATIMTRFEDVCLHLQPDLVIVAGDVNSTLAASLTAAKLNIPVAHVEAGLRSFDRSMPEEINRLVTDSLSSLLFTTEESGNRNLISEGISNEKLHFVGNTMIDSLVHCRPYLEEVPWNTFLPAATETPYVLATIHRPANVDDPDRLRTVISILESVSDSTPVLLVAHPRTRDRLRSIRNRQSLVEINASVQVLLPRTIYLLPALPYLQFLKLMSKSSTLLTDSGGVQEETTFLGIPCLTMRDNTERPITLEVGTNELVGLNEDKILSSLHRIKKGQWKTGSIPPLWDGKAARRIVKRVQCFLHDIV